MSTTIAVSNGLRPETFWAALDKELWSKRILILLVCAWLLVVVVLQQLLLVVACW